MTAKRIQEAWDKLRQERDELAAQVEVMREALKLYADGDHFIIADENAWDTVSGEPQNFWEDEANTATVEDGSIAKHALALPNTAAILRQRDAMVSADAIQSVADNVREMFPGLDLETIARSIDGMAELRRIASELERKNA